MDPEKQLESFIEEAPPERREETLHRFFDCVAEILQEYRLGYSTPVERLQAAVTDKEEYAPEYGENHWTHLVDLFVIHELYFRTLH